MRMHSWYCHGPPNAVNVDILPEGCCGITILMATSTPCLVAPLPRQGQSWRRMLVSRPPPQFLATLYHDLSDARVVSKALIPADVLGPATAERGLRMGQLYDFVLHRLCAEGDRFVWFRILWNSPREHHRAGFCQEALEELMTKTTVAVEFIRRGLKRSSLTFCGPLIP